MSCFLTRDGPSALSDFRRRWLCEKLGALNVEARYVHYIALKEKLEENDQVILEQLLTYGDGTGNERQPPKSSGSGNSVYTYYVSPRTGTISPWSSKATCIAHVCGFGSLVRRIERGIVFKLTFRRASESSSIAYADALHDRMTQEISHIPPSLDEMFADHAPKPSEVIDIHQDGGDPQVILEAANKRLGLALDESEINYLVEAFSAEGPLARSPYDVELFMFAQVNSEHCRHKQFNASWTIDGLPMPGSLFDLIRDTHRKNPKYVISAYSDNAAVLEGNSLTSTYLAPARYTGVWTQTPERVHYLAKVETHNHPTAVSPYPGAATGSGGEIRDEGAVGRGSKPKAGLCGFSVSDLLIPDFWQPWELDVGKPNHIASSLEIMLEAPIGSAAFNNEFGRPCIAGYFRTLLTKLPLDDDQSELRGYHKPIIIAGGVGSVRPQLAIKRSELVPPEAYVIVLGGPAMLIGLGGGAASSVMSGEGTVDLDFASVQRGNAEVQRRAQEVINACSDMGVSPQFAINARTYYNLAQNQSPILFIHDVGAGGLSNALPELVHDSGLGAKFELRDIDNADKSMSPLQIWCCEAQERYVMAVARDQLNLFKQIADRERCGYSIVGQTKDKQYDEKRLVLLDRDSSDHPKPIDLPMSVLFGKPPKLTKVVKSRILQLPPFDSSLSLYIPELKDRHAVLNEAVQRVLALPAVGSKSFLITIGDRTVGGLTARDQMVGPWQTPVADVAVTATSLTLGMKTGEAMTMGEKPTVALISPAASARMAMAESLMNIAAADLQDGLERIRLSANWMSASSHLGEGAAIYEAVHATNELCQILGISIPVGKDSMSMKMKWTDQDHSVKEVTAPLSLVVSAFAPVRDITNTWTPTLRRLEDVGETVLLFVDLALDRKALGGSALAQVFGRVGDVAPDVHDMQFLRDFFDAVEQLQDAGIVLAYHDRSDGGILTLLLEMMFAGRCGLEIMLDEICPVVNTRALMETLFNEELGAVFQVRAKDETEFHRAFATCGPPVGLIKKIGRVPSAGKQSFTMYHGASEIYRSQRVDLQTRWAMTSYHIQKLRDNPACADAERGCIGDNNDPGLSYNLTFNPKDNISNTLRSSWNNLAISWSLAVRPRVAILREQGVNGHAEMAFAFMSAGFTAVDVHMTDLISGSVSLSSFVGLAACGGFSYGDVLGAGQGWAKSVLLHTQTREEFRTFFERKETFTLGVCNGCQFLSRLKGLIPGADSWPTFERNISEQYEARVCMVRISDPPSSPSVFLHGMDGTSMPVAVAHGEGRAYFGAGSSTAQSLLSNEQVAVQYVENHTLLATEKYPANPNGSPLGIAGVRSVDGRVLALMPHPERTVMAGIGSWIPHGKRKEWGDFGPWGRLFASVRRWVG